MSTYLVIIIASIIIPLLLSFDKKVAFFKYWKFLIPSIIITGIVFILWDIIFTRLGIWSFNPSHLTGIYIFGLPLEECLFFIAIPYSSVFTYEVLRAYLAKDYLGSYAKSISIFLILLLLMFSILFNTKLYTFVLFLFTLIYFLFLIIVLNANYLGWIYLTYALILIPFLLINGILTGTFLNEPVVIYNQNEIMGIKLLTFPLEDIIYGLLLFTMNISIYEKLKHSPSRVQ